LITLIGHTSDSKSALFLQTFKLQALFPAGLATLQLYLVSHLFNSIYEFMNKLVIHGTKGLVSKTLFSSVQELYLL